MLAVKGGDIKLIIEVEGAGFWAEMAFASRTDSDHVGASDHCSTEVVHAGWRDSNVSSVGTVGLSELKCGSWEHEGIGLGHLIGLIKHV